MTPRQLRMWMQKYGNFGVLIVFCYLSWRHLRSKRRSLLLGLCGLMGLLGTLRFLMLRHPHPAHSHRPSIISEKPIPSTSELPEGKPLSPQEQANDELIAAIKREDEPAALAALNKGADPNSRDHSGEKPLSPSEEHQKRVNNELYYPFQALDLGKPLTALGLLLASHSDNPPRIIRQGHLMTEVWVRPKEHPTLLKALLEQGADPNVRIWETYVHESTPLIEATQAGYAVSLRLLLEHGAKVNAKDRSGCTALYQIPFVDTMKGKTDILRLLIAYGADVNIQDEDGDTPLMNAARRGSADSVRLFLTYHADVNKMNDEDTRNGLTALDFVLFEGEMVSEAYNDDLVKRKQNYLQIEKILRKAGAKTGKELSSQITMPQIH